MTEIDYDVPPEELTQEQIRNELDTLTYHVMYTADMVIGPRAKRRDDDRIEELKQQFEGEYKHDPDDCIECAREEKIMEEHFNRENRPE